MPRKATSWRREHGSRATLIAISGYRNDEARQRESGIDHHLTRPVDQRRLQVLLAEGPAGSRPG